MSEPTDQDRMTRVANKAYERYVARGQSDGHDLEDWLVAEREIASEEQGTEILNERLNERVSELSAGDATPSDSTPPGRPTEAAAAASAAGERGAKRNRGRSART